MAAALLVFCAWIGAQRPDQQPVPPAFKSGVQMLEVNARVFDTNAYYVLGNQPANRNATESTGRSKSV